MKASPRLRSLLAAGTTAVIFALLFTRIPLSKVAGVLGSARVDLLLIAMLLTALFPVMGALRWRVVLKLLGYPISLLLAFRLIMAAWPVGVVTPSKSGDLIRAYYLKDDVPPALTLGAVLAERALDVLTLLVLSAAGAAVFGSTVVLVVSAGCLAAGLIVLGFLITYRGPLPVPARFQSKIQDMLLAFRALVAHPGALALASFYTGFNWLLSIFQTWILFLALGNPVSLAFTSGALPLAIFAGLLPVTISGMGTRDGALVLLYRGLAPAEVSLGVGLLYTFFGYWLLSLAGLPFLRKAFPKGTKGVAGLGDNRGRDAGGG
jgi:uncharacterized membrane protein YbhN (UPF0104 family)